MAPPKPTDMGALELLAKELHDASERIAGALLSVADALGGLRTELSTMQVAAPAANMPGKMDESPGTQISHLGINVLEARIRETIEESVTELVAHHRKSVEFRRPAQVFKISGYGKTAYYAQMKLGLQLPFVPVGRRAVAIPAHEQDAVNAARAAGRSDPEIQELVRQLVAARTRVVNAAVQVEVSASDVEDPATTVRGRKGGLKGGKTRMAALTAEQRCELAQKAAAKRWGKKG